MEKVRIIVPCFNEESCVEELYQKESGLFITLGILLICCISNRLSIRVKNIWENS